MRVIWICLLVMGCDANHPRDESAPPHIAFPPEDGVRKSEEPPPPKPEPTGSWTLTGTVVVNEPCGALFVTLDDQSQRLGDSRIYLFEVPDGTYRLSAFADCNHNGVPDLGDLRYHNATDGEPYRSYVLKGRGVISLPLEL